MTLAELEAENAWLREQLGTRDDQVSLIRTATGLEPQNALVLSMLYAARGRWILADWLDATLPLHYTERRIRKNLHVYVFRIRAALGGRWTIETRGKGADYAMRLTAVAADRLALRLQHVADKPALGVGELHRGGLRAA
jgi:hypothetical protein